LKFLFSNSLFVGTLVFGPGETEKTFQVAIIDDDIFEEDEHFVCKLSNIRVGDSSGEISFY